MTWLRGGHAPLSDTSMTDLYGRSQSLPVCIAVETSQQAIERDQENPAVNVVLYNDAAFEDEQNDFFFETLEEAVAFCSDSYAVARHDWIDLGVWRSVAIHRR